MMKQHRPTLALLVLALAVAGSSCGESDGGGDGTGGGNGAAGDAAGPPSTTAGHRRMVEELARHAVRVHRDCDILGTQDLVEARRALDALAPGASPVDRGLAEMAVGEHLLRLGKSAEALEHMERAEALCADMPAAERAQVEPQVLGRLAVAAMRLGETSNCVAAHNPDSCRLPIRGGGVHRDQRGSRRAIGYLERLLAHPDRTEDLSLTARWLMNIACMTVGEYPDGVPEKLLIPLTAFTGGADFPRFFDVAPEVGLNTLGLSGGAIADDFDGDGDLDVFTSTWDVARDVQLFRNEGGRFVDVSEQAGLAGIGGGLNLVQADYDNDGDLDVLVLRGAWLGELGRQPSSLLRNDGRGRFTDVTFEAGLAEPAYPTQTAAWADYDNDGDLDLYVGAEATRTERYPGRLFRNEGDGRFTDVAAEAGVTNLRYAKGVTWGDVDEDGWPDLYVSNLASPNRLYRNLGNGRFIDIASSAGVTGPSLSFPTWFWDFDNDGHLDLYVGVYVQEMPVITADYLGLPHRAERGRLYRGDGTGRFRDVSRQAGLTRLAIAMGANFGDLDGDGWPDFYLGTGFPAYEALLPNVMYRNRGGRRFEDVTVPGGFGHLQKGHAISFADLDDDGDQDVFQEMGGAYPGDEFHDTLYENPGFGHHWVTVTLRGVRSNRCAIGARVRVDVVDAGKKRSIHHQVGSGGSFGANPLRCEIGLGGAKRIERLEIFWPTSGRRQVFEDVAVDRFYEVREDGDELREIPHEVIRWGS